MLPSPALEQPVEGGHAVDDRGSLLFRGLRERGGEWSEARRGQVALDPRLDRLGELDAHEPPIVGARATRGGYARLTTARASRPRAAARPPRRPRRRS